jgi:3-oxoacyl-[acyl-carrier protein] reductase
MVVGSGALFARARPAPPELNGETMSRVIVVSGGGTGIGRAIATAHARDGDQVVIMGRRADVLKEAAGAIADAAGDATPVDTLAVDLADAGGAEHARAFVADRHGRVDVLVANAGGNVDLQGGDRPPGLAGLAESWTANFRMNVLTAVLLTEALSDLLASPGGRVIMMSSIAAYRGSGIGSYGSVKAALHPYVYDTAAKLGERGITVNAVAPGFVDDTEFFAGRMSAERRDRLVAQTLNRRPGAPADIAETVRWLASPEAGHITAQIIQVNGGAERGH